VRAFGRCATGWKWQVVPSPSARRRAREPRCRGSFLG